MNELDALRKMVDHYPGGRAAVALRLGKSPEVLRKELAGAAGFKLGVSDAGTITELCTELCTEHASAYASAVAARCEGHVVLLPKVGDTGADLFQRSATMVRETTEVMAEIASRAAGGSISPNGLAAIEKEAREALAAFQSVMQGVHAAFDRGAATHSHGAQA